METYLVFFKLFNKNKIIICFILPLSLILLFLISLELSYFWIEKNQLKNASLINIYELFAKFKANEIKKIHYTYKSQYSIWNKEHYLIQAESFDNQKYYCKMAASNYDYLVYAFYSYKDVLVEVKENIQFNFLELYFKFISYLVSFIFGFYILIHLKQMLSNKINKFNTNIDSSKDKITFADVAGLEEEKKEIQELIDFLKHPQKYHKMGFKIPKGVLLEGPPGTGKTLLAKALANEVKIPFYAVSGSEFVEVYVGVGASRIRDLFQKAKRTTPCIIFIDEIDALGAKRKNNSIIESREHDQSLNQLLLEMDGFFKLSQIIIIAATNRIDMLDPALIRPGRFDRKIKINLPNLKAREAILKVHAKNKNISLDVDFYKLALITEGASGAQLAAILNEALILAIRNNKDQIDKHFLEQAIKRILN
ncbi:ATP-dependent Zn protease [Onion yellows phytoplasma OY-M]|uniref:ATP-dependent Zn protease n=1 Tax=Onion yellows phytoplasma (strain OY-M) TaxID=262768 RepID=Q6YQR6_ONYPE|nr:ATP-dependent Zn protease [Onion yellows phytoplasma OY-M]